MNKQIPYTSNGYVSDNARHSLNEFKLSLFSLDVGGLIVMAPSVLVDSVCAHEMVYVNYNMTYRLSVIYKDRYQCHII